MRPNGDDEAGKRPAPAVREGFGLRTDMSKNNTHDSDVAFVRSLAELLRENDLTELQVKRDYGENDGLNVRVSRHVQQAAQIAVPPAAPAPAASPAAAAAPAAAESGDPAE